MKKNDYRANLNAADFLTLDGEEMQALAAAAIEKAMQRRERDNGQDIAVMHRKYQEDARQEMIVRAYDMIMGTWIHGEYVPDPKNAPDVTAPRAYMPLALFAAIAAGKALDAIIYQDGGHNVKLSAKEAREHYDGDTSRAVITCKRVSDPIAPAPEAAAIHAETLPRIIGHIKGNAQREAAAALMLKVYVGLTLDEAAADIGFSAQYARRVWQAICNAAALVKVEDGETADLERIIESDEKTLANRRAREAARAALDIVKNGGTPAPVVDWTKHKPSAVEALRRMSYIERCNAGQKALADAFNAE